MTERNWKSGPPPHIGWWNASAVLMSPSPHAWRWWDGRKWSFNCQQGDSDEWLKNAIPQKENYETDKMVWSDYYPENARVPRVDPSDPKNNWIVAYINASVGDTPHQQFWAGRAWAAYDTQQFWAGRAWAAYDTQQIRADAVRAADVDFSGAMKRNQDPEARRRDCRASDLMGGSHDCSMVALRSKGTPGSNGQAQAEVKDPLREYSSVELLQEVIRRLR